MSAPEQLNQLDIDFLPQKFREQCAQRRQRVFQLVGAGVFAGMLLICSTWQWHASRTLHHELAEIAPIHENAHQRTVQLTTLKQELATAEQRADLLTYLRHPWPKTQLIAAVTEPMPKSIKLSELTLGRHDVENPAVVLPSQRSRNSATTPKTEETKMKLSPAQEDLKELRAEFDPRECMIYMAGETTDVSELHEYLGELSHHPLIVKAELRSIESGRESAETQFRARIVVRAGYGQPNGPVPANPTGSTPAATAGASHHQAKRSPSAARSGT